MEWSCSKSWLRSVLDKDCFSPGSNNNWKSEQLTAWLSIVWNQTKFGRQEPESYYFRPGGSTTATQILILLKQAHFNIDKTLLCVL